MHACRYIRIHEPTHPSIPLHSRTRIHTPSTYILLTAWYSLIVFYTHAHGMHAFKILQPETLLPFAYCFIGFHFPAVSAHVVSAKYTRIWTDRHSIDICLHPYSCFSCVIWVIPIKYICKNVLLVRGCISPNIQRYRRTAQTAHLRLRRRAEGVTCVDQLRYFCEASNKR